MLQSLRMTAAVVIIFAGICCPKALAQEKKIKTGWSINPCPVIAYETDLGFQYGAMCDIYYYGDGKDFPDYEHKIFVEAAYSTKHSGLFHIFYDSEHLIKGLRLTASATYIPERMHNFYGFNGFASPYYRGLDKNKEKGMAYYNLDYQMLRVFADLQGGFAKNFRWAAGVAFYRYFIGDVRQAPYAGSSSLYRPRRCSCRNALCIRPHRPIGRFSSDSFRSGM